MSHIVCLTTIMLGFAPPAKVPRATSSAVAAGVGDPSWEQCYNTCDCFVKGKTCTCCVKKYDYYVYTDPAEICFAYEPASDGSRLGNSLGPDYPAGPCFDSGVSQCFDAPNDCYCCHYDYSGGYQEFDDMFCFAYTAPQGDECSGTWPVFADQAALQQSQWGAYFTQLYGSMPPDDPAQGWYPLHIDWFWLLHDLTLITAKTETPNAKTCPDAELDRYTVNNYYQPPSVSWIWHAYPFQAFASNSWVEVIHEADPFGDEHYGMWLQYARGSGIFFDIGNTIAFPEHGDAMAHFGASGNEDMSRKAAAAGYDSIQFLAHVDHTSYQCDTHNTGKPGFDYMGFEIVAVKLTGTYACGAAGTATPDVLRRGWADTACDCDNSMQFLNCKGVPVLSRGAAAERRFREQLANATGGGSPSRSLI